MSASFRLSEGASGRTADAAVVAGLVGGALALAEAASMVGTGAALPLPFLILTLVSGCPLLLTSVAILLVWRISRVLCFAVAEIGATAAVLALVMVKVWHWWGPVSAVLAVVAAGAVGLVVELVFVRRLGPRSRIALTVATLALGQLLVVAQLVIPSAALPDSRKVRNADGKLVLPADLLTAPHSLLGRHRWQTTTATLTGDHLLLALVTVGAVVGLAAVLGRSRVGATIRAVAERPDRVRARGVAAGNVSAGVWTLAAMLAAVGPVLLLPVQGVAVDPSRAASTASANTTLLLAAFAACMAGSMRHLGRTVAAAVAIQILGQGLLWSTGRTDVTTLVDAGAVIVALAALGAGRSADPSGRAADEGGTLTEAASRPIPAVLARLPEVQQGRRRARLAGLAAVLALPFLLSPSQLGTASAFCCYGIGVVSMVVLTGWAGQVSLGHAALLAVGAVAGGHVTTTLGLPFPLALLAGSLAGGVVALLLAIPARRATGPFLAIVTLAVAAVSQLGLSPRYADRLPTGVARPSLAGLSFADERWWFLLCAALLTATVVGVGRIRRSALGRSLVAARDNVPAATSFGIDPARTRVVAGVISGLVAGGAGSLLAHQQLAVRPDAYGTAIGIQLLLMAVIGGLGSIGGALLGAGYFALVDVALDGLASQLLASGALVLVLLMYFPSGLAGLALAGRDAWLRSIAARRGLRVPSIGAVLVPGTDQPAPLRPKELAPGLALLAEVGGGGATGIDVVERPPYRQASLIRTTGASQRRPRRRPAAAGTRP